MFKKFVIFEIEKKDTTIIVDEFSKYTHDLTINDVWVCGLVDREIYCVCFHCRLRDHGKVTNKIVKLLKNGVSIRRLSL